MRSDGEWGGEDAHVPDESELRAEARRQLQDLRANAFSASGGFTAMKDDGVLNLFWGEDTLTLTDGIKPEGDE